MDLTQASFDEKLTALFALSDSSLTFAISPLVSQSVLCTASLSDKNRHPPSNFDKSFVKDNNHTIIFCISQKSILSISFQKNYICA